MSPTGNSDIHEALADAMSSRPYTHRQDVDTGITAVITVEEDMRFLRSTLRSVLTQNVLPGVVIIADATGRTSSRITTSFEVIPSPSGPVMEVPQSKHVTIHIVSAKGARSFGDAVSRALDRADLDDAPRALWLLHDDSRPSDDSCLERLLEAWRNTPGASVLGCKQCDWEGSHLHDVGMYAGHHAVHSLVVDGEPDQEQYDGRQDVFAVSLAGALVSMSQFTRLRGINAWLTTYSESVDFCRRVCLSGGRVVVVPQAEISHRRARYEGIRTRGGEPLKDDHTVNHAMTVHRSQQRYLYTDLAMSSWFIVWLWRLLRSFGMAISMMFGKKPYEAWVQLCLPWLALADIAGNMKSRSLVARQSKVAASSLHVLFADSQQIKQFHDRRDAFQSQQGRVRSVRWNVPIADTHHISLECGRGDGAGVLCGHRGDVLAGVPFDILRRIVVFRCVASHRCQLHATGAVRHHAVGVWQRHRHSCAAHAVAAGADAGLVGHARPCDRRFGDDTVCGRAAERIVVLGAGGRIHPLGRGSCAGRTAVGIHRHYVRLVCAGQYADAYRNGVPAGSVRIRVPCRGHVPYRRPAQAAHIRSGRGHRRTVLHPCGGR